MRNVNIMLVYCRFVCLLMHEVHDGWIAQSLWSIIMLSILALEVLTMGIWFCECAECDIIWIYSAVTSTSNQILMDFFVLLVPIAQACHLWYSDTLMSFSLEYTRWRLSGITCSQTEVRRVFFRGSESVINPSKIVFHGKWTWDPCQADECHTIPINTVFPNYFRCWVLMTSTSHTDCMAKSPDSVAEVIQTPTTVHSTWSISLLILAILFCTLHRIQMIHAVHRQLTSQITKCITYSAN